MATYTSHLKILGEGAYGDVHKTKLNKSQEIIAIKRNFIRKDVSYLGSLKELDFLTRAQHPNIIALKTVYLEDPFSKKIKKKMLRGFKLDSLYFGMELAQRDGFDVMTDPKVNFETRKKIVLDLILGLDYLHSQDIIHRDIKPTNFVQVGNSYKWCDFGMSLQYCLQDEHPSEDITTDQFRAPELVFGARHYNHKIDLWSIGILMLEIMTQGRGCFFDLGNRSFSNRELRPMLLKRTLEVVTKTDLKRWYGCDYRANFKNTLIQPKKVFGLNKKQTLTFNESAGSYEHFLDLFSKLIVFDPQKRFSAHDSLAHPFFSSYQIEKDKPEKTSHMVEIVNNDYRKRAVMFFENVFTKDSKNHYRHRIIFHALRIYDRFLLKHHQSMPASNDDVNLYMKVCYYISTKLFLDDPHIPDINEIFEIKNSALARKIEIYIIDHILQNKIYEETLYELVPIKMNSEQKSELYKIFVSLKGIVDLQKISHDFGTNYSISNKMLL